MATTTLAEQLGSGKAIKEPCAEHDGRTIEWSFIRPIYSGPQKPSHRTIHSLRGGGKAGSNHVIRTRPLPLPPAVVCSGYYN